MRNWSARFRLVLVRTVCLAMAAGASAGCQVLDQATADASTARLSWLALLAGSAHEDGPRLDPEQLRPISAPAEVAPETLLEVTIWDLFEPEKPHTFPVRVAADSTIDAPMLGSVPIAELGLKQIEERLADEYRKKEILLKPRVLVRSLEPQTLRVSVAGAVQQPGFLDLPRRDANVYTALLSAGGPRKGAGVHIGISRQKTGIEQTVAKTPADGFDEGTLPSRANNLEVQSVAPEVAQPDTTPPSDVTWYDVTNTADCEVLRKLTLSAGDSIIIKPAVPPVRIGGDVARPGPYTLPVEASLTLWQVLDMAGGPAKSEPFEIVLIRPGRNGRGPQRFVLDVTSNAERPPAAPVVQAGDVIHVSHVKASPLKNLAGRLSL